MGEARLSLTTGPAPAPVQLPALPPGALGMFPLSQNQESLWLFEQMVPGTPTYNLPEAWHLTGRLQLRALRQSLSALLERHEALRTVFIAQDAKPAQCILPPMSCELPLVDLTQSSDKEAELARWLELEARKPFDLTRAPLLRAGLFRLGQEHHVMLINMHHIISDAWSQGVFMRDLTQAYAATVAGKTAPWPELPIQYADFAVWQQEALSANALKPHQEYWRAKLHDPLPPCALAGDHPRTATIAHRGCTSFDLLPEELVKGLRELSRAQSVTLFITLLAAFKTLLYRYTRQEDIVVGSPMAGRGQVEVENLIGFFVNTHALRTHLGGDPSFIELLGRVRETVLGGYAHQDLPFERVVQLLRPERDPGRHPFYEVVFGLQSASPEEWSWPELKATRMELDNGTAKFDWTLLLTETNRGLQMRSEHSTELFEPGTIRRLSRQFEVLLRAVLAAPHKRLSELPLITAEERAELLSQGEPTRTEYERGSCIQQVFEAQVAANREAVALAFKGREMTYGELNRRANRLARQLQAAGVRPRMPVGLCLERSSEMIIAMLGILKAGGIYVPLDRSYPKERLAFLLKDTQAMALVTDTGFDASNLPLEPSRVLRLGTEPPPPPSSDSDNLACATGPEDLAYLMYTSGSTGTPKGVAIPHRGVLRLVRQANYIEISHRDVFLQLAPISFDASTLEIWGALLNGAKLVIFPPHLPSLAELKRALQQEQITILWLTAGWFHQMVDNGLAGLNHLRYLLAGGEALSAHHVQKAARELSSCTLINGYGPTENTTFTCCYRVPPSWDEGASVPIGRPISNTQVYILDEHLNPAPIGAPGELYAGGDGLAQGYWQRPELTAAKFIASPFRPGQRLYRTGDLARWLADGNIEFLGRIDEQIKIRGFRIEPGEIEAALIEHPSVAAAVVVARPDRSGTRHLVAYLALRPQESVSADDFRAFLQTKLPQYMIPTHFVTLQALPLTPNGKVDQRALPEPDLGQQPQEQLIAPRTPVEAGLTRIWSDVLERETLSVHSNFFQVGGHSLLATQIISRIAKSFEVDLPVRAVFEAPTIAALAEEVERARQRPRTEQPAFVAPRPSWDPAGLLSHLDELTDEQVEEMLETNELGNLHP